MFKRSRWVFASLLFLTAAFVLSGCSGRWHKAPDADMIIHRIDERVEKLELNLNDAQKQKLEAFKKAVAAHINGSKDAARKAFEAYRADTANDGVELNGLFASIKVLNAKRAEGMNDAIEKLEDFYNSLDKAQKKKVLEELKDKAKYIEKRFEK